MSSRMSAFILAGSLAFTGTAGFFTAQALSASTPTITKTITISNGKDGVAGPAGPPGPQGPKGDPGATTCPPGFQYGKLVINHPGGQVTIAACLQGQ